jgi:hypothetical protein
VAPRRGDQRRKPKPVVDDAKEKDGDFPMIDGCLMIFGGMTAYDSKRHQNLVRSEVYAAGPATPSFLWWSGFGITFDRSDHPKNIP